MYGCADLRFLSQFANAQNASMPAPPRDDEDEFDQGRWGKLQATVICDEDDD